MHHLQIHDSIRRDLFHSCQALVLLVLMITCGCEPKESSVSKVIVTPGSITIEIGATTQMAVALEDESGNLLSDRPVTWSSDNIAVATVTSTGVVTGKAAGGPAIITATCDGQNGLAQITVTLVPVGSIALGTEQKSVEVGETFQLEAIIKDRTGNLLTGRTVSWISGDPLLASVSNSGVVTGIAEGGPLSVIASCDGKSSSALITVSRASIASVEITPNIANLLVEKSVLYSALVRDVRGGIITGRTVIWSTSNNEIVNISASGRAEGLKCGGPVTITATIEGKNTNTQLTVNRLPGVTRMLESLPEFINGSLIYNQSLLAGNPGIETQIKAIVTMLQSPTLANNIIVGNFYSADSVTLMGGKQVSLNLVFPLEIMRTEADRSVASLKSALPFLEYFVGTPFYYYHFYEWYGFRIGNTNAADVINMEDRLSYESRTGPDRLLYEDILYHELSHCYMGNETLTHFLAVYLYNMVHTKSTNIQSWIYFEGPYTPLAESNTGLKAVLDIYRLIGHESMMRVFKKLVAIYPPYGSPLSSEARQVFIDEAPANLQEAVAAKAAAI